MDSVNEPLVQSFVHRNLSFENCVVV